MHQTWIRIVSLKAVVIQHIYGNLQIAFRKYLELLKTGKLLNIALMQELQRQMSTYRFIPDRENKLLVLTFLCISPYLYII